MSTDYSIYLISNDPSKHQILQNCLPDENVRFFDGSGYPSFSKLVNDAVASSPTELVIILSDKVRPKPEDIQEMVAKLKQGYALVGLYRFACFGLHKDTFRQIGAFDTRYEGGGFEDYDFVVRLIERDLAFYIVETCDYEHSPSKWRRDGAYPGYEFWATKWAHAWEENRSIPVSLTRTVTEQPIPAELGPSVGTRFKSGVKHNYTTNFEHVGVFLQTEINSNRLANQRIVITGGTGSWGQSLVAQLLESHNPREITILSRGELAQVTLKRRFLDPRVKTVLGDVRDLHTLTRAFQGADLVFHLAALKHVPVCESNPEETIKTNIDGTRNVCSAAQSCGVGKVVYVSSDKACEPVNLYGMTKAVGEKLIVQANVGSTQTKFVCIRGGNVLGSSGSVVPLFIDKIQKKQPISVTDPRMTRFFLTQTEAITLLLSAAHNSVGGETFVMKMPSCSLQQLTEILQNRFGETQVTTSGIRPGEKLHEVLVGKSESTRARVYNKDYYVILPEYPCDELQERYAQLAPVEFEEFSSNQSLMSDIELTTLLTQGGFLCE
jgi:UDP-N-acetylglucosamine 4,6-dehydratase